MADIVKRLRYFTGQFLVQKDFADEQSYHLDRLRRHQQHLHRAGWVTGLEVETNGRAATVTPGMAVDPQGRTIVLDHAETPAMPDGANQKVLVVIGYRELDSDPAGATREATRTHERPVVLAFVEGAPLAQYDPATDLTLARLTTGALGVITAKDESVRQQAGVRLGDELEVKSLRLRRDVGVPATLSLGDVFSGTQVLNSVLTTIPLETNIPAGVDRLYLPTVSITGVQGAAGAQAAVTPSIAYRRLANSPTMSVELSLNMQVSGGAAVTSVNVTWQVLKLTLKVG